jgi:hypothetical protein
LIGVADSQGVNDAVTWERVELLRDPCHADSLTG